MPKIAAIHWTDSNHLSRYTIGILLTEGIESTAEYVLLSPDVLISPSHRFTFSKILKIPTSAITSHQIIADVPAVEIHFNDMANNHACDWTASSWAMTPEDRDTAHREFTIAWLEARKENARSAYL